MNVCMFTGNISRIGTLTQTAATPFIKFTVAVNRKMKNSGADFVGFTAFGKTAEFVDKWCKVGSKVSVQSRYQQGSYDGKDGKKVYTHDFIVDSLEKISSKADDEKESLKGFAPIPDGLEDIGLPFN